MPNGDAPKHASGPFNGSSLSHLTGAKVTSRTTTEVRLPASSIEEVLENIHALRRTGQLTLNYHNGKPMDLKWSNSSEVKPSEI